MPALSSTSRVCAACCTAADPLANIRTLEQPANIVLVMQEGRVVKQLR